MCPPGTVLLLIWSIKSSNGCESYGQTSGRLYIWTEVTIALRESYEDPINALLRCTRCWQRIDYREVRRVLENAMLPTFELRGDSSTFEVPSSLRA